MNIVTSKTAKELTEHYDAIEDDAFDLLQPDSTPKEYMDALLEKKYFADSIVFLAHALPKRQAIWWACLCSKFVANEETTPEDLASLNMSEQWVYEPDDSKRRLCGDLAQKSEYKTSQSWVAVAVFWSGGSISDEEGPTLEPGPFLCAHAVSGAILNAVGVSGADDIDVQFQDFITQGLNIADGGNG